MTVRSLLLIAVLGSVVGCERAEQPAIPALTELPGNPGVAPARLNGSVGAPQATPPSQISYGTPGDVSVSKGAPGGEGGGDVSLDFADTDIREVVAQILGNMLKLNYTIDPAVHGSATLRTVTPLSRTQLLPTLQSLLAQNGAAVVQSGNLYRVVPANQAGAALASDGTAGTIVVQLHYASAEDLAKVLQPYVGEGGKIVADVGRNALLISGDPMARASLIGLVQTFDTDILGRQSYALLPVSVGDVKDFASAMQDAMRGQSGGALAGMVRVVPLTRINAVLVVSPQSHYIDQARRVYALIDRARQQTVRSWHVYYLQNSHAEDIAYVLQQAFTPGNVTAQPTSTQAGAQRMANAVGGLGNRFGAGGGMQGGYGGGGMQGGYGGGAGLGGLSAGGISGVPVAAAATGGGAPAVATPGQLPQQQQGPAAGTNPLLGPLEGGGTESNPDTLRIIPDDQNNAVLLHGTEREVNTIQAMLHKVDILPLQVRIDAVIAEVTLNDNLQYGTQFFFKSGGLNGILSNSTQSTSPTTPLTPGQVSLNMSFPGFFIGGHGLGGAPFAINALQAVTQVSVLSSPELLVLDNQPARLQVGNVVPYLSQSSQSTITANAPIVNSVQYQQTGVVMEVTPRVNSGGLVTLDIQQDVSEVAGTVTTPGLNSPTFNDRNVSSRVVVQDGQTVGLAGLIRDNAGVNNQGIPWLKDVPLLGFLAGNQNNTRERTELLILITPHVMHDQRDALSLTEDLREQLINAASVPDRLNSLRPSGSPDPGARIRRDLKLQP